MDNQPDFGQSRRRSPQPALRPLAVRARLSAWSDQESRAPDAVRPRGISRCAARLGRLLSVWHAKQGKARGIWPDVYRQASACRNLTPWARRRCRPRSICHTESLPLRSGRRGRWFTPKRSEGAAKRNPLAPTYMFSRPLQMQWPTVVILRSKSRSHVPTLNRPPSHAQAPPEHHAGVTARSVPKGGGIGKRVVKTGPIGDNRV